MTSALSPRRVGRFLASTWPYLLLFPLVVEWGTLVHEAAHAAAAAAQGATVTGFHVLPEWSADGFRFGYVTWDGPVSQRWLVHLAPGLASTLLALATLAAAGLLRPSVPSRLTLIFLYFLPLVDVSMSLAGLYRGSRTADYWVALHGREAWVAPAAVAYFAALGVAGSALFRRAWPDGLSPLEYGLGYAGLLAAPWVRFA